MKNDYELQLEDFYQIEDDDEYELAVIDSGSDYFKHKLSKNGAFFRVWDAMVNDPVEVEKLRKLFGTEFSHINNHYKKIKDTQ